ncbi:MAG: energy transducer TonB [Paludibacteraceae bacterium]|nr:energy transducer TonB [Paludibacteraceae bacterium]
MKKKLLLLLLMAGPFVAGMAAEEKVEVAADKAPIKEFKDGKYEGGEVPVFKVEKKAEFPGGNKKLMEYLRDNLVYPKEAQEKSIEGRVLVSFVVKKDGSIGDVTVERSVDPILDAEAVRVVKSMPNWTPAQLNGRDVSSIFRLPFLFKLPAAESNTKGTNPAPAE